MEAVLPLQSAKSSLAQLQNACAAANEEHARTKTQLFSLQQQVSPCQHQVAGNRGFIVLPLHLTCTLPCLQHLAVHGAAYTLEGLKTPLGSKTSAQQLQALHTENLQLKACLKQEVEARQLLEKKHMELLDLLRCVFVSGYGVCCSQLTALAQRKTGQQPGLARCAAPCARPKYECM